VTDNEFWALYGEYLPYPRDWTKKRVEAGQSTYCAWRAWYSKPTFSADTLRAGLAKLAEDGERYPSLHVVRTEYDRRLGRGKRLVFTPGRRDRCPDCAGNRVVPTVWIREPGGTYSAVAPGFPGTDQTAHVRVARCRCKDASTPEHVWAARFASVPAAYRAMRRIRADRETPGPAGDLRAVFAGVLDKIAAGRGADAVNESEPEEELFF